jgi:hypothetical protein
VKALQLDPTNNGAIVAPKRQVIENADATGGRGFKEKQLAVSGHVAVSTARRFRPNFDIIDSAPFIPRRADVRTRIGSHMAAQST